MRSIRPLPAAHWSLPVAIVASALFVTLAQPCREGPFYVELAWLLLSGCAVLWSNHLALAPVRNLRQLGTTLLNSIGDAVLLFVWFIVVALPVSIFLPTYQCYTQRVKAGEVALSASALRSAIGEKALARGTLDGVGRGVQFAPSGRAVAGYVSDNGQIIVVGEDPPVAFVLTPTLVDGKVQWQCRGFPSKVAPGSCRGEK